MIVSFDKGMVPRLKKHFSITYVEKNARNIYKLGELIQNKKIIRLIIIDNYGNLPFMILAKMKGLVVAQISDENSAHMTREHNNANVLCLGTKLNSPETMIRIIKKFNESSYEGGRHQIRLDMLNNILEKGEL